MDQLLIDLKGAWCSWKLWDRDEGINEFDLVYVSGVYYLFLYDRGGNGIYVRQAATREGLFLATETLIIAGNYSYPTAQFDSGVWHVMAFKQTDGKITYFTSATSSVTSTYAQQSNTLVPQGYTDPHLRFNPADNKWVLATKAGNGETIDGFTCAFVRIFTSDTIGGTYTDKGFTIPMYKRKRFHRIEEADPAVFFNDGKIYLLFASYDGIAQRIAGALLDSNYQLSGDAFVLVNPLETWQKLALFKINNPVPFVAPDGKIQVFFDYNVAFGAPLEPKGGWAYLEVRGDNIWSGKNNTILFGANFHKRRDDYTGADLGLHGVYSINENGITLSSAQGGAYGYTGAEWHGDFTLKISFTPGNASGNQWLLSLGDQSLTNYFGIFLDTNNNLKYSWGKVTDRINIGYVPDGPTELIFRKINDLIQVWVNGNYISQFNATSEILWESYRIGNKFGFDESAAEQFVGTIKEIELYNEILRLDS